MTSKERKARIKPGASFMVGGNLFRVVQIEGDVARVLNTKTGKSTSYGVDALARFNLSFVDK